MLLSSVQPVAMDSAGFFLVWMFVDAINNRIVEAYSGISLVTALYVERNV